ncbi:PREDICTED: putative nuclease HARBI1 [Priapulus caudatus]|uniref:Nuclease HARBI1 n=1 Tax=Priapulus caudatus TaxID=37621 RepID=A0ABM1ESV2_PRICU|nr:PREDICTED: putative nuclease HARBI1 [Priapulus caudatus]
MAGQYSRQSHIPFDKQVLVFVYYCATQDPLMRIGDFFGICEASVYNIIDNLSNVMINHLQKEFIKWPSGAEIHNVFNGFSDVQGIPNVLGALDGTHIPIKSPKQDSEAYVNRRKFHSINVSAICNHEMLFTYVYSGWPGSTHDSRVFKNSTLAIQCENDNKRRVFFPENSHLLGDSAYELTDMLLTPFKDNGNRSKIEMGYNYKHSSTRMKIENAFGLLKGRFRRLKYIDMHKHNRLIDLISSCFVMHNICLLSNDMVEEYLQEGRQNDTDMHDDAEELGNDKASGIAKRRAISILLES